MCVADIDRKVSQLLFQLVEVGSRAGALRGHGCFYLSCYDNVKIIMYHAVRPSVVARQKCIFSVGVM